LQVKHFLHHFQGWHHEKGDIVEAVPQRCEKPAVKHDRVMRLAEKLERQ
jgi:hypothetical protein